MRTLGSPFYELCVGGVALSVWLAMSLCQASGAEQVLYSFHGGSDGIYPARSLTSDSAGNLYGTTVQGGGGTGCYDSQGLGCGAVFKLAANRSETVLYAFPGGTDGAYPWGGVILDSAGNLYGTAVEGGEPGAGIVFKLAPDGTETQLYAFQGGNDGMEPWGNLIMDGQGNLYGVTQEGGGSPDCGSVGCGTVFELSSNGTETVLHAFQAGSDGAEPWGGLLRDTNGDLFGTTRGEGSSSNCGSYGCGVVFEISAGGTETVLYNFQGSDGEGPTGTLVMDQAGDLYGTTVSGGAAEVGTVFKLAPNGIQTVLYSFQGAIDGEDPISGVIMDKSGNLYGATSIGGGAGCKHTSGCGTVFEVTQTGRETTLCALDAERGRNPEAGLLLGAHEKLYGTAMEGGKSNDGVVFSLKAK